MSYGIVRVQKMGIGSVKGIEIHDCRKKDFSHTNQDINWDMSLHNYDLCNEQNLNFTKAVKERIEEKQKLFRYQKKYKSLGGFLRSSMNLEPLKEIRKNKISQISA